MTNAPETNPGTRGSAEFGPLPEGVWRKWPWVTFLLPLAVYTVVGIWEPTPTTAAKEDGFAVDYRYYPLIYTLKIALTVAAMLYVLPGYRSFRWRVSPAAIGLGVVGAAVWIGLCQLQLESRVLEPMGLASFLGLGERPAFNPWEQIDSPLWANLFLAVRFFGLVVVVAITEEFFLRGFVMRILSADEWWTLPLDQVTRVAIIAGTVVPMLYHPAEMFAALAWFSAVTWLMLRTGNLWDCVLAHATTNLLLGLYVVTTGDWRLW